MGSELSITIALVAQQPFVPGVVTFRPLPVWVSRGVMVSSAPVVLAVAATASVAVPLLYAVMVSPAGIPTPAIVPPTSVEDIPVVLVTDLLPEVVFPVAA